MTRVREDLTYGRLLNNLPGVHDCDAMGNFGDEGEVVTDEDHRESQLLSQLVQKLNNLLLHRHVKCRCWLIRDHKLRVTSQSHSDQYALTLPT